MDFALSFSAKILSGLIRKRSLTVAASLPAEGVLLSDDISILAQALWGTEAITPFSAIGKSASLAKLGAGTALRAGSMSTTGGRG